MTFELQYNDTKSNARAGLITTDHGVIETPIFMPVGTQGTVKGVHMTELKIGVYLRDGQRALEGTICTAWVGQCSEQAPQSVPSVFTIQRLMKKVAMPTCVVAFSSLVSGFIACVGQTSEQTVHS